MDTDFEWPCNKHYAHGPHTVQPPKAPDRFVPTRDCPGVKAHPNTMIGRGRA